MPNPRLFGATKTRLEDEYTTRPFTEISPDFGRSSPAIERSVVVFPQPLGPSSVKSCPSATAKFTSCAALTISPRSFGYSVKRPSTVSTLFSYAVLPPEPLGCHHEHEQGDDEEDAERRQLNVLAILPQLPDDDGNHLRVRTVEQ